MTQQLRQVISEQLRRDIPIVVVDRVAVDTPRVGRDHGVIHGEQICNRRERRGIRRAADQQHAWPLATYFFVHMCAGRAQQGVDGRDMGSLIHMWTHPETVEPRHHEDLNRQTPADLSCWLRAGPPAASTRSVLLKTSALRRFGSVRVWCGVSNLRDAVSAPDPGWHPDACRGAESWPLWIPPLLRCKYP